MALHLVKPVHTYTNKKSNFACRVCLAVDNTNLYSLHSTKLGDFYEELVSTPVSPRDRMPQYICSYCKALLLKAVKFRRKCRNTVSFLQDHIVEKPLTTNFLRNIKSSFELPYGRSDWIEVKIPNNDDLNDMGDNIHDDGVKSEILFKHEELFEDSIHVKSEVFDGSNYDDHDIVNGNHNISDNFSEANLDIKNFFENFTVEETGEKLELNNARQEIAKPSECKTRNVKTKGKINKRVFKTGTCLRKSRLDKLKESYLIDLLKKPNSAEKKKLLNYVIDKYERKLIEFNKEQIEIVSDDDINYDGTEFRNKEDVEIIEENLKSYDTDPITRQRFYAYIRDIYVYHKDKFKFQTPNNYVDLDLTDRIRKLTLEDFAKDYDFKVKTFDKIEEQREHLKTFTLSGLTKDCVIRCELCFRGFSTEAKLRTHIEQIHDLSVGPVLCPVCGARSRDKRRLQKHALYHKYRLQCNQCEYICKYMSDAKLHYDTHKGQMLPCPHCDKVFKKYKSRSRHVGQHHPQSRCDICCREIANEKFMKMHCTLSHRETFPCAACETIFNTEEARTAHVRGTTAAGVLCSEIFPCSACGENFKTESEKQDHIIKNYSRARVRLKTRCCPCACRSGVKVPEPKGLKGKKRMCGCYCSRKYRDHLGREKQTYMCEICARSFQNITQLRVHQLIHTGEKPFECDHCGRKFRVKMFLEHHMTSHTGERNYPCSFCDKKFLTPSGLHRHQRAVHLKLRPHQCEICAKMYATSTELKMHIRTKHVNLPWPKRNRPSRSRRKIEQ